MDPPEESLYSPDATRLAVLALDDKNSNELWSRAINSLDPTVVTNINFSYDKLSILSDLRNEVEDAQRNCDKKRLGYTRKTGEKVILRDVFGKIVKWINIFKEVGDVAVQYDPGHAALPWALVRFLLQASIADIEKYEFLVENIEVVSRYICRCRLLEKLYIGEREPNTDFRLALVRLYGQILLYLARAKGYFNESKVVRVALSAFRDKSKFEAVMDKISKAFDDVNKSAALIRREEDCARYLEFKTILQEHGVAMSEIAVQIQNLAAPVRQIAVQVQNFQDNLDSIKRREILQWMSDTEKLPYLKHHKENKRQILKGTGEWLLNDHTYNDWKQSTTPSLLWLHGIPGSGKSKLTSLVIEDGLESYKQGTSLRPAFFYCSRNTAEPGRSDAGSILASIARQLSSLSPSSALLPPVVEKYKEEEQQGHASGALDIDDAQELILELVALYPITFIIIDALDECSRGGRAIIIDFIKTVIRNSSSIVKFFISSREDGDIVFHLGEFPSLRISSGKNQTDIEAFVKAETKRLVDSGSLLRHSQKQQQIMDEIIQRVARDAKGMFRWASLQLQSLTELKTDADIILRLGKVPPTLQQLYLEIYEMIMTNHGPVSQKIARNGFNLLLGAKDDFTLPTFLAFVTPNKTQPISLPQLLDICSNLIVLDETSKIIRFAHLSVREFFEDLPEFTSTKVHSGIGSICLEFIDIWKSSIFGFPVDDWTDDHMQTYTYLYLGNHLEEAGRQEKFETLLPQLFSLLKSEIFSTLDDRSFEFPTMVHHPPIDYVNRWIITACDLGFKEIVELVIEGNLLARGKHLLGVERSSLHNLPRNDDNALSGDALAIAFDPSHLRGVVARTWVFLGQHALRNVLNSRKADSILQQILLEYSNTSSRSITAMTFIQGCATQTFFEDSVELCQHFEIVAKLKEMNESLVVTKKVLIAATSGNGNFLERILNEWSVEESIMTPRLFEYIVGLTGSPHSIKILLERWPSLSFSPAAMRALNENWIFFYLRGCDTTVLLNYLQAREDFQISKDEVLREAVANGTAVGWLKWLAETGLKTHITQEMIDIAILAADKIDIPTLQVLLRWKRETGAARASTVSPPVHKI